MAGRPTIRIGDFHAGHKCIQFHATPFITGSTDVFINNRGAVRFGDKTACTDVVIPTQTSVFVNGRPIATMGSPTTGHAPCFPPTVCANGSPNVFATQEGS
jgi:hypothetical protein